MMDHEAISVCDLRELHFQRHIVAFLDEVVQYITNLAAELNQAGEVSENQT